MTEPDIARRAFDTVAAINEIRDPAELDASFQRFVRSIGFEQYATHDVHEPRRAPRIEMLRAHAFEAWEAHYQAQGHVRNDAVVHRILNSSQPVFWSDVVNGEPLSPESARIFAEAGEFGLREGFVTPIHNVDGSISIVLMSGGEPDAATADTRTAAHLVSLYYAAAVRRNRRPAGWRPRLTPRQLECLKWTREGKSAADIGDILGISRFTVQEHLTGACARLGVRTKVQALAQAYVLGLLRE